MTIVSAQEMISQKNPVSIISDETDVNVTGMLVDSDNSLNEITVTGKMPEKIIYMERKSDKLSVLIPTTPFKRNELNRYDIKQDFEKYIRKMAMAF